MWIVSNIRTVISKIEILPGKHRYALDYKDPVVAAQLRVMKSVGAIDFAEDVSTDKREEFEQTLREVAEANRPKDVRVKNKTVKKARKSVDSN